jgi:hypothetical protein
VGQAVDGLGGEIPNRSAALRYKMSLSSARRCPQFSLSGDRGPTGSGRVGASGRRIDRGQVDDAAQDPAVEGSFTIAGRCESL